MMFELVELTQRLGKGAGEEVVWYGSLPYWELAWTCSPEMSVLNPVLSFSHCLSLANSTNLFPYLVNVLPLLIG